MRGARTSLGTQPCYQAPGDLRFETWITQWLKSGVWGCPFDNGLKLAVGQIAENQKAEKINLKMSSVYNRIKLTFKILQHLLHDFWSLIIL